MTTIQVKIAKGKDMYLTHSEFALWSSVKDNDPIHIINILSDLIDPHGPALIRKIASCFNLGHTA